MKYKIGQILISKVDTEIEYELSGETVVIPKGNRVIIGADKLAHHFKNHVIQPLQKDAEVDGYDCKGIAEYLYMHMRNHFEIDVMLEDYDDSKERFVEELEHALDDIGF